MTIGSVAPFSRTIAAFNTKIRDATLATYATGRSLSYNEIEFLKEKGLQLKANGYRMQDMLRFVVQSELFLEK